MGLSDLLIIAFLLVITDYRWTFMASKEVYDPLKSASDIAFKSLTMLSGDKCLGESSKHIMF